MRAMNITLLKETLSVLNKDICEGIRDNDIKKTTDAVLAGAAAILYAGQLSAEEENDIGLFIDALPMSLDETVQ
jgi:predicted nuclease with RNAse H fold